jgi:hypothetical protein
MQHERSNFPKLQIREKTLSTTEIVRGFGELSGTRKRDQSFFSLLLEIESRLRREGRNDQIEQRKRSKGTPPKPPLGSRLPKRCMARTLRPA